MLRRWHWVFSLPMGLIVLALFVGTSPFWLARWPAVRNRALDASGFARIIGGTGGTQRVRVDRVVQFGPGGIRLEGVRAERIGPAGWETWARAGTVDLAWRPADFLSRRIFLSRVVIDSLRVDLRRRPPAGPPAPARPDGTATLEGQAEKLPPIRIPTLQISRGVLIDGAGRRREGSLELTGIAERRGRVRATLHNARVDAVPESLWIALSGGVLDARIPTRARITALEVEGPGLRARLDANWSTPGTRGTGPDSLTAGVVLDELRPTRIGLVRAWALPWNEGDSLTGRVDLNGTVGGGRPAILQCGIDMTGSIFGTGLDTLFAEGSASADTADLREVRLRLGSLGIRGNMRWLRSGTSRADLRFHGVDLGSPPVALFAQGLPVSEFDGTLRAEADSLGPRIHLRAALELEPGILLERPISGLAIRARLDPEALTLEDLHTREDPPALSVTGTLQRRTQTISAEGALHGLVLQDWVAPWLGMRLEGTADGPFRLDGPLSRPAVKADLAVSRGRVEGVVLDSLRVTGLEGTIVPTRLRGAFRASGINIYKVPVDSISGWAAVSDTIATGLTAWRDSLQVTLAGRVRPAVRGTVFLDSLRAKPGRLPEIALARPARLDWSPELVQIDSLRLESTAGRAGGRGWLRSRPNDPGSEPFSFAAEVADLDLGVVAQYFGLPAGNWSGLVSGRLDGEGTLRAPVYRFRVEGRSLETMDWAWDDVTLSGSAGEGIGVRIDSLRARATGFTGPLPGAEAVGPQPPGPLVLVRADTLYARFAVPWEEAVRALSDSTGRASLLAATRLGGSLVLERVPAAPFLIPVLGPRAWEQRGSAAEMAADPMLAVIRSVHPAVESNGAEHASSLGGSMDLTATIGGTGRSPEMTVDLLIRRLRVMQAWADSLRLRGAYARSLLTIDSLDWHMGPSRGHLEASLPWEIDLSSGRAHALPGPRHVRADLQDADLSLVSLVPTVGRVVQDPSGRLNGWLTLSPRGSREALAGHLEIADGSFRVANREERFRGIRMRAEVDSAGLHLNEVAASLGEKGRVTAHGTLRSLNDFDVTATVRDGVVYDSGNYRFVADADLRARTEADGDSIRPRLTGEVRVLEGLITQDLAKPPPAGAVPARTPWLVDLHVIAPANFRLNQPAADVDLGEGDLQVSFRWPYWNLGGSMQVVSGRYRIFNRNLSITSGSVTFQDTGLGPNPYLDITASTELAGMGEEPPIPVEVSVKGYPAKQELTVTLSSSSHPEYSEARLIELMSVGQLNSSAGTLTGTTRQALSSELMGQVERQLVSQLPWIDRVQLEGQLGGTSPLRINLRPIVQPQWSLVYSQDLASSPDREVAVNYRLSNLLFLNAAVDRRRNEQGFSTDNYLLDLKLRFEY